MPVFAMQTLHDKHPPSLFRMHNSVGKVFALGRGRKQYRFIHIQASQKYYSMGQYWYCYGGKWSPLLVGISEHNRSMLFVVTAVAKSTVRSK